MIKKPGIRSLISISMFIQDIVGLITLYIVASVVLSIIPVNRNFKEDQKGIPIYIVSNNIHTDIVMPVNSELYNWSDKIILPDTIIYRYVSFGWGEKNFYLETPSWADFKFSTGFKAAFFMGTSAMHVTGYIKTPEENKRCKKVMVSNVQYLKLANYIHDTFKKDSTGKIKPIDVKGYNVNDLFYNANKTYSLFFTCNSWTNKALKQAGLKASFWTPIDKGILFQYYGFQLFDIPLLQ
jgi:uncharacterized protein (TIGR02117 family)